MNPTLRAVRWSRPGWASAPRRARGSRRTRAAWSLGIGVALVVAMQAGLALAAELSFLVRDPSYGDREVRLKRQFAEHPGAASVVMVGTSRTGYGFHSPVVREAVKAERGDAMAFNFGVPASGPVTHLTYVRRLFAAGLVPDLLLVEVLPPSLAELPDGPLESRFVYGDRFRGDEVEPAVGYGFPAEKTRAAWRRSATVPWYALRFPLLGRVSGSALPWYLRYDSGRTEDPAGWTTPMVTEVNADTSAAGLARAVGEYRDILADFHPEGGAVRALGDLLALCRDRGVAARLVLMPESEGFRAIYPPATTERLYAVLRRLEAEHAAPLVDARDWLPTDAFTDGHHMLRHGAVAFSERLTREVIAPYFRTRPR